jgi:FixJ family two-component response regulator
MDGRRRAIAILDDEEPLRRALARLLAAHGYDAECYARGEDLLAAVVRRRYDCVLLDLFMPGMSGFDVLAALQSMPAPPPVVVVTAHDDPALAGRASALGAIRFRRKPVTIRALLDAIEGASQRLSAAPADPPGH